MAEGGVGAVAAGGDEAAVKVGDDESFYPLRQGQTFGVGGFNDTGACFCVRVDLYG